MRKSLLLWLLMAGILLLPFLATAQAEVPALEAVVTLDKTSVDLSKGESITATCTAEGGVPPYSYDFNKYLIDDGENIIVSDSGPQDEPSVTFTPDFGQAGFITVHGIDSEGNVFAAQSLQFAITDDPDVEKLTLYVELNKTSVDITKGESITATVSASGGEAPLTYSYHWSVGDGSWYHRVYIEDYVSSTSSTFRPIHGMEGNLYVEVSDLKGRTDYADLYFSLSGDPSPISVVLKLDKESVSINDNERITLNWIISGGHAPYTADISVRIFNKGSYDWYYITRTIEGASYIYTPYYGETGRIRVEITDSIGRKIYSDSKVFTITGSTGFEPLSLALALDKAVVDVSKNESIMATITASGGITPYTYKYSWYLDNGDALYSLTDSNQNSMTPTQGKAGVLEAVVYDANGFMEMTYAEFEIIGAVTPLEPGDANGDSTIDILDLVSIIDYIVSNTEPTSMANADANGDESVDILDLVWVIDRIVGA